MGDYYVEVCIYVFGSLLFEVEVNAVKETYGFQK